MKWYNKRKYTRERHWVSVECTDEWYHFEYITSLNEELVNSRKIELQRHPSSGKFSRSGNKWLFENPEDALYCKLAWLK